MNDKTTVSTLKRVCMSIGELPTSYLDSMSYYEMLVWFTKYLTEEVTPAVNNNAEAVQELQSYVANYFDNLDVQEEVDHKLDEMASDGTLAALINQEIFDELNQEISDVNDDVQTLKRTALYIGNSYTNGTGSTSGTNGIFNRTKNLFDNAYKKTGSGTGFLEYEGHTTDTFNLLLESAINDTSIPNDEITDVIIIGAWGDTRALRETITDGGNLTNYQSYVQSACTTFMNNVNSNFPNIKRVCYVLAESRSQKTFAQTYPTQFSDTFWVHNSFITLLPKNGIEYLGWIGFNIMLDNNYFSNDHFHPNDNGYKMLSSLFKTAYCGKFTYKPMNYFFSNTPCGITSGSTATGMVTIYPETTSIILRGITLAAGSTPGNSTGQDFIDFGNLAITIPYPAGAGQTYELGTGLICTTSTVNSSGFNPATNYNARLQLQKSTLDSDSVKIRGVSQGTSKTVSDSVSCVYTPVLLTYSNGGFQGTT